MNEIDYCFKIVTSKTQLILLIIFFKQSKMQSILSHQKTAKPTTFIQPKLMVNAPNDVYEQEADAVADRVMRMPLVSSKAQGTQGMLASSIQRKCAHCEEEKKMPIMRKAESGGGFETSPQFSSQLSNTRGGGNALPTDTQSFMENRFGRDFSHVRLHTDGTAANMSAGIQAKAFTHGSDIYFNRGEFQPNTEGGKRLLAHELTHTVQQGKGIATQIQRLGDLSKVPPIACDVANTSPNSFALTSLFPTSSSNLSIVQRNDIDIFVTSWQASGGTDVLRIDGYASTSGSDAMNWQLSCDRALSVANEMRNDGVPDSMMEIFAEGETSEFGSQRNNQRATISLVGGNPIIPPAVLPPICPNVPTTTPGTCSGRHDAYCEAAKCLPSNPWLQCVCAVSEGICRAADGFNFIGMEGLALAVCIEAEHSRETFAAPSIANSKSFTNKKGQWFLDTNHCIWGHWRAAFDAIHDSTRPIPSNLTPEWAAAVSTCRRTGVGSSECCEAHIVAEQSAIDTCEPYNSSLLGKLPTDVPFSPGCGQIVASQAPPPAFTGDFGNLSDRIAFGKKRCCSQ